MRRAAIAILNSASQAIADGDGAELPPNNGVSKKIRDVQLTASEPLSPPAVRMTWLVVWIVVRGLVEFMDERGDFRERFWQCRQGGFAVGAGTVRFVAGGM